MTDPAPTPWKITGSSILDAEGRLVCVLAGRLLQQHQIIATIAAAPEMHRLLIAVERQADFIIDSSLADEISATLNTIGSDK